MSTGGDRSLVDHTGEAAQRRDRMQACLDALDRAGALADGDPTWREVAWQAVDDAGATWARHVPATEAPDGILADVLAREPRLAHLVDTLQADHREVAALLDEAAAAIAAEGGDEASARRAVARLRDRMARHHAAGAELLYEAYAVDLGGGG